MPLRPSIVVALTSDGTDEFITSLELPLRPNTIVVETSDVKHYSNCAAAESAHLFGKYE